MLSTLPYIKHTQRLKTFEASKSYSIPVLSKSEIARMAAPRPAKQRHLREEEDTLWISEISKRTAAEEERRFKQFEVEEMKRAQIEKEMDEQLREKKAAIISTANELIYAQDDRVKALNSSLMFSDAISNFQLEMELKARKAAIEARREARYEEQRKTIEAKEIAKENAKAQQLQKLKEEQQAFLKIQNEKFNRKYIDKVRIEKLEGEVVKHRANEAAMHDQRVRAETLEMKKAEKKQMMDENARQIEFKRIMKKKVLEEEQKAEEEALEREQKKLAQTQMHKEKVLAKQQARELIISQRAEELRQIQEEKNQKLDKEIEKFELRTLQEEQEAAEKQRKKQEECFEHQRKVILQKQAIDEANKQEQITFQKFLRERNLVLKDKENRISKEKRKIAEEVSKFNKSLEESKLAEMQNEIDSNLDDKNRYRGILEDKDSKFRSYAEKVLTEWEGQGKNIMPVLLELKKRKEMLA